MRHSPPPHPGALADPERRRPPAEQAQAECGHQRAPGAAAASKSGSTQPPSAGRGRGGGVRAGGGPGGAGGVRGVQGGRGVRGVVVVRMTPSPGAQRHSLELCSVRAPCPGRGAGDSTAPGCWTQQESRLGPGSQWPSCHARPQGPGQASAPATQHQAVPLCLSVLGGTEGTAKGGPFKMHGVTSGQQGWPGFPWWSRIPG